MKRLWLVVVASGLLFVTCMALVVAGIASLPAPYTTTMPYRTTTENPAEATTTPLPRFVATTVVVSVLATALHIRSGPGISHPVTGWLRRGDMVKVLSCRGNWARIRRGYVNSRYLSDKCKEHHENRGR